MLLSVIICTYERAGSAATLLDCLSGQSFRDFEVLVVDGSRPDGPAAGRLRQAVDRNADSMDVRLIPSPKGLTRQRNCGLALSRGELILFLDDDVTFACDFLSVAVRGMSLPGMEDVGGMSGYDNLHYGQPWSRRWRMRAALGVVPALRPGNIDRLGRSVPIGFVQPFSGFLPVGFLYGFCMLYRKTALDGLAFDVDLPTYGGEDRDFSSRVGRHWRLVIYGDLHLEHHSSPESRDSAPRRVFQAGFGTGRALAQNASSWLDYLELVRVLTLEFLVDAIAFLAHPARERLLATFTRGAGLLAGFRSASRRPA